MKIVTKIVIWYTTKSLEWSVRNYYLTSVFFWWDTYKCSTTSVLPVRVSDVVFVYHKCHTSNPPSRWESIRMVRSNKVTVKCLAQARRMINSLPHLHCHFEIVLSQVLGKTHSILSLCVCCFVTWYWGIVLVPGFLTSEPRWHTLSHVASRVPEERLSFVIPRENFGWMFIFSWLGSVQRGAGSCDAERGLVS